MTITNGHELPSGFTVEEFTGDANLRLLENIVQLRTDVWNAEGVEIVHSDFLASGRWKDELDKSAFHWAVRFDGELVAATRLSLHASLDDVSCSYFYEGFESELPGPLAVINRTVVKKRFRNRGVAKFLDAACIEKAKQSAVRTITCDIPEHRVCALRALGFRTLGEARYGQLLPSIQWIIVYRNLCE